MLREVLHFIQHAPGVARMSFTMPREVLYDTLIGRAEADGLAQRRASLVRGLAGNILEIGCGTGRMFPHFESTARVIAIDPDRRFLRLAIKRATEARANIALEVASVEALPFRDGAFDAVVMVGVLCSVPAVDRALAEIRRVLRDGGQCLLIEHVLSERAIPAAFMRAFNPLWRLWNRQGCNMNRAVEAPLRAAGLAPDVVERFQLFCPGIPAFPSHLIRAVRQ